MVEFMLQQGRNLLLMKIKCTWIENRLEIDLKWDKNAVNIVIKQMEVWSRFYILKKKQRKTLFLHFLKINISSHLQID